MKIPRAQAGNIAGMTKMNSQKKKSDAQVDGACFMSTLLQNVTWEAAEQVNLDELEREHPFEAFCVFWILWTSVLRT